MKQMCPKREPGRSFLDFVDYGTNFGTPDPPCFLSRVGNTHPYESEDGAKQARDQSDRHIMPYGAKPITSPKPKE